MKTFENDLAAHNTLRDLDRFETILAQYDARPVTHGDIVTGRWRKTAGELPFGLLDDARAAAQYLLETCGPDKVVVDSSHAPLTVAQWITAIDELEADAAPWRAAAAKGDA